MRRSWQDNRLKSRQEDRLRKKLGKPLPRRVKLMTRKRRWRRRRDRKLLLRSSKRRRKIGKGKKPNWQDKDRLKSRRSSRSRQRNSQSHRSSKRTRREKRNHLKRKRNNQLLNKTECSMVETKIKSMEPSLLRLRS